MSLHMMPLGQPVGLFQAIPMSAVLLVLKATVVFSLAGFVAAILRGRSASARHIVWLASLLGALALLPLTALGPRLAVPLPVAAERAVARSVAAPDARVPAVPGDAAITLRIPNAPFTPGTSPGPVAARRLPGPVPLLAVVWLAGCAGVLLWSAFGHLGLWGLHRSAIPVERSAWERHHGLEPPATGPAQRVRLALSSVVGTPLTWGFLKPIVLLPSRSSSWPLERRRAALLHELAHVERGDYLAQLVATWACAVYWFHPLAWWATGRLRSESEHACDDRVLAAGTPAPEYASDLLAVAHGARGPGGSRLVAIGMARRSHLEGRLLAVLDETRRRGAVRRLSGVATLAGTLLLLVPFAGLTPRLHAAPATPTPEVTTVEVQALTQTAKHTSTTVNTQNSKTVVYKPKDEDEQNGDDKHSMDDTIPVKPGGRLVLDLDTGGSVEIHGWDRNEVRVHFTLGGADWRSTQVAIGPEPFGVGVRAVPTGHQSYQSTSHRIDIRVPQRYDVRLHSAGGSVTIDGVEGTFAGTTGGGELMLTGVRGRASLSTGGGDIEVSDSDLSGSVSTGGGTVKLSRVKGGLRGSSGSGPVIYAEADQDGATGDLSDVVVDGKGKVKLGDKPPGYLHISRAGGEVDLDEVPNGADIQTGGGDIRIARGAGTIQARTGGGDIWVGPIAGSVTAGTGAGDVHIRLASVGGRGQSAQAWTGTGTVVVELPSDLNARIELETSYTNNFERATKITSAWTLEREPVTDWDDSQGTPRKFVRATGMAGKGAGLVHIQTVNGDIELRKVSR